MQGWFYYVILLILQHCWITNRQLALWFFHYGKYNRMPNASPAKARFSFCSPLRSLAIAFVGSSNTSVFEVGTPPVRDLLAHVPNWTIYVSFRSIYILAQSAS